MLVAMLVALEKFPACKHQPTANKQNNSHTAYTTRTDTNSRIFTLKPTNKNTYQSLQGLLPELKLNMSSIPAPRIRRTAQNTQFT